LAGGEWIGIHGPQSTITYAHVNDKEVRQPLFFYLPSIPPLTLYFKFLTANFVAVVYTALLTICSGTTDKHQNRFMVLRFTLCVRYETHRHGTNASF